jgi:hypothetical protein
MAGRRIRWASVGRAAAIALAVIGGLIALPALLGGGSPPPVPADVGLAPPPATAQLPPAPAVPPPALPVERPQGKRDHGRERSLPRRARSHPERKRLHARHRHHDNTEAPSAPALPPLSAAPTYSYVPPPSPGEFRFER